MVVSRAGRVSGWEVEGEGRGAYFASWDFDFGVVCVSRGFLKGRWVKVGRLMF